jgi:hypothetical protein
MLSFAEAANFFPSKFELTLPQGQANETGWFTFSKP